MSYASMLGMGQCVGEQFGGQRDIENTVKTMVQAEVARACNQLNLESASNKMAIEEVRKNMDDSIAASKAEILNHVQAMLATKGSSNEAQAEEKKAVETLMENCSNFESRFAALEAQALEAQPHQSGTYDALCNTGAVFCSDVSVSECPLPVACQCFGFHRSIGGQLGSALRDGFVRNNRVAEPESKMAVTNGIRNCSNFESRFAALEAQALEAQPHQSGTYDALCNRVAELESKMAVTNGIKNIGNTTLPSLPAVPTSQDKLGNRTASTPRTQASMADTDLVANLREEVKSLKQTVNLITVKAASFAVGVQGISAQDREKIMKQLTEREQLITMKDTQAMTSSLAREFKLGPS